MPFTIYNDSTVYYAVHYFYYSLLPAAAEGAGTLDRVDLRMATCANSGVLDRGSALAQIACRASFANDAHDVSGIAWLEHVNLVVGRKELVTAFFFDVLGLTRDPTKHLGPDGYGTIWANVGPWQQLHLVLSRDEKVDPPQVIAGSIGLAVPNADAVLARARAASDLPTGDVRSIDSTMVELSATHFKLYEPCLSADRGAALGEAECAVPCFALRCPWGNMYHIYQADARVPLAPSHRPIGSDVLQAMSMVRAHAHAGTTMAVRGGAGIRFIELECVGPHIENVADFYRTVFGCNVYLPTWPDCALSDDGIGMEVGVCRDGAGRSDGKHGCATGPGLTQRAAVVDAGPDVHLIFAPPVDKDFTSYASRASKQRGVHVCCYIPHFRHCYNALQALSAIWSNPRFKHLDQCDTYELAAACRQFRFKSLRKPVSAGSDAEGKLDYFEMLELEHEVRSMTHCQYLKHVAYNI